MVSERGEFPVEKRPMKQWVLKITAYAERLLKDLDEIDWPESIKEMQRNWIGKSNGALVDFKVKIVKKNLRCLQLVVIHCLVLHIVYLLQNIH